MRGASLKATKSAFRTLPCATQKKPRRRRYRGFEVGQNAGDAEMLDEKPDLVLAFPGNKGTRDMLRRAEDAKKKGMPIEIKKVGW